MDRFERMQGVKFDEEIVDDNVDHPGDGLLQLKNQTTGLDPNSLRQALNAHLADSASEVAEHGANGHRSSSHVNDADPLANLTTSQQENAPLRRGRNIEDCVREILGRPVSSISPLLCPDGDTWIFIKPPAREPEYSEDAYKAICERYKEPFVGRYTTLMNTQSPLFKKQLGDATQQFRIVRRLKVKQEMEKNGIKYVMDLTPPDEGDEAVQITSDLSCPLPILNWVHEAQLFKVSDGLVAGIDELTPPNAPSPRELPVTSTTSKNGQADYTPLRHRAAIERVLLCLHGFDIVLDSAPKLYTTVMAATKHLQIPAYSLTSLADYVTVWLRAVPNNAFIELHPDVSLQIADALQIEVICQDSFAILVGEAALEAASLHNSSLARQRDFTIHSRLLESTDEVWETRIQYARNAFLDRIQRTFSQEIIQPEMRWVELLPEVAAIPVPQSKESLVVYSKWLSALKDFAKGAIYHILCSHYSRQRHLRNSPPEPPNIFSRLVVQFQVVFNKLNYRERLLTRSFWSSLAGCEFEDDRWSRANTAIRPGAGSNIDSGLHNDEYTSLMNAGEIRHLTSRNLEVLSFQLLDILNGWSYEGASSSARASSSLKAEEPESSRGGQQPPGSGELPLRTVISDSSNDELLAPSAGRKVGNSAEPEAAEGVHGKVRSTATGTQQRSGVKRTPGNYKFDVHRFVWRVQTKLQEFGKRFLTQATSDQALDFDEIDTLVCLNQDEMKYLPLWAGGTDDGSNGVFDADLPTMPEDSSFGPARQDLRRSFAGSESDYDGASTTLGAPTVATSRMVNDGRSVIMDRRQVYAEDEIESVKFDDSVSNAGTETTWEGIDRDDVSVSTSSDLAGAMSRTEIGLHSDTDSVMEEGKTEPDGKGNTSDLFALSEDEDQGSDDEELDLGDSDEEMLDDSDFEVIETAKAPPATKPTSATQKQQSTKEQIASWAAANPSEANNTIRYRERSLSPLVFEKS